MENFHSEILPDLNSPTEGGSNLRRMVLDILQTLLISFALFIAINAVSARIRVESVSMMETLAPDDFVLVNRLAYRMLGFETGKVDRGDVVVFTPPVPSQDPYVKRVIGLPGEVVTIRDGKVYINDKQMQEPYTQAYLRNSGTWEVPEGEVFVMGDNRHNSSDSRSWGTVPVENIIGKALFIYWPVEQWGSLTSSAAVAADNP